MKIFVPGQPQAKERARARIVSPKFGKQFVQMYTPSKTVKYEEYVGWLAKQAMRGSRPTKNAVQLELTLYFEVPKNWPKWKQSAALDGLLAMTAKPDADNVLKAVKDALNKIVWDDDSQVIDESVKKRFSKTPGVSIEVLEFKKISPCQIKKRNDLLIQNPLLI